jgi:multicomponent Na+:H+ antiporter subunit C
MSSALVFGITGAGLIAIGLYGFLIRRNLLRQIVAFNLISSGIFLLFGALGARSLNGGSDPVPQAMIITGIVVALSTTALAIALITKLHGQTGRAELLDEREEDDD